MIKSFADRRTVSFNEGEFVPPFQSFASVATRKLDMIRAAAQLADLRSPPSNRLEALVGDRAGQHSIRINQKWRICFVWNDGAERVEIVDYH